MKKKVLISSPRYYGIDTDIREAFDVLGLEAVLTNHVSLTILERVATRIGTKFPILKPLFNPILKSGLIGENKEFVSIVSKESPDLLFIIKGDFLFPATLKKIRDGSSCRVAGYVWDDPFYTNNKYQDDYRRVNFKKGLPWYDKIFVFDEYYIGTLNQHGAREVRYLPLATNPNRYRELAVTKQERCDYSYDVCFIGVPFEDRVKIFDNLREYKLGVFGDHWDTYFRPQGMRTPSYYRGKATGETVNKIYLSSKIVLNIHHSQSIEGLNTRTFDIPACGAFEIVDYKKDVERHFAIDKEIVTFRNIDELKTKIDFYLKNDDLRKTISENGKHRVRDEHTWVHRIDDVMTALRDLL